MHAPTQPRNRGPKDAGIHLAGELSTTQIAFMHVLALLTSSERRRNLKTGTVTMILGPRENSSLFPKVAQSS